MIEIPRVIKEMPDGELGKWTLGTFTVSEEDVSLTNMRMMFKPGFAHHMIYPGTYRSLKRGGTMVMSTTSAEVIESSDFLYNAKGSILINGLGLGFTVAAVLAKPETTEVTVIEIDKDVIDLIGPHLKDPRLTIIHADAHEYKPPKGKQYDCVWHDIWDYICSDNLPSMHKLHRKYGRRTDWQASWCRAQCEMNR